MKKTPRWRENKNRNKKRCKMMQLLEMATWWRYEHQARCLPFSKPPPVQSVPWHRLVCADVSWLSFPPIYSFLSFTISRLVTQWFDFHSVQHFPYRNRNHFCFPVVFFSRHCCYLQKCHKLCGLIHHHDVEPCDGGALVIVVVGGDSWIQPGAEDTGSEERPVRLLFRIFSCSASVDFQPLRHWHLIQLVSLLFCFFST